MLIDTHAHLDYTDYDPDRAEVIARATEAGVTEIISGGTRIDSSARAVELAENFPNIWATVGIHPGEADSAPDDAVERLRALAPSSRGPAPAGIPPGKPDGPPAAGAERLRALAQSSRVAAIGEIGLDYHHLPENPADSAALKERQARLFREQLDLTAELGLNAVIHQRDSWDDTLDILRGYTGRVRGVFHCFGGTLEQAREVLALGHLVSFTGIVTFKNARQAQETARALDPGQFM